MHSSHGSFMPQTQLPYGYRPVCPYYLGGCDKNHKVINDGFMHPEEMCPNNPCLNMQCNKVHPEEVETVRNNRLKQRGFQQPVHYNNAAPPPVHPMQHNQPPSAFPIPHYAPIPAPMRTPAPAPPLPPSPSGSSQSIPPPPPYSEAMGVQAAAPLAQQISRSSTDSFATQRGTRLCKNFFTVSGCQRQVCDFAHPSVDLKCPDFPKCARRNDCVLFHEDRARPMEDVRSKKRWACNRFFANTCPYSADACPNVHVQPTKENTCWEYPNCKQGNRCKYFHENPHNPGIDMRQTCAPAVQSQPSQQKQNSKRAEKKARAAITDASAISKMPVTLCCKKYFSRSGCKDGEKCPQSHPSPNNKCPAFPKCKKGVACPLFHEDDKAPGRDIRFRHPHNDAPCTKFFAETGCKLGEMCDNVHITASTPHCIEFNKTKKCVRHDQCIYLHEGCMKGVDVRKNVPKKPNACHAHFSSKGCPKSSPNCEYVHVTAKKPLCQEWKQSGSCRNPHCPMFHLDSTRKGVDARKQTANATQPKQALPSQPIPPVPKPRKKSGNAQPQQQPAPLMQPFPLAMMYGFPHPVAPAGPPPLQQRPITSLNRSKQFVSMNVVDHQPLKRFPSNESISSDINGKREAVKPCCTYFFTRDGCSKVACGFSHPNSSNKCLFKPEKCRYGAKCGFFHEDPNNKGFDVREREKLDGVKQDAEHMRKVREETAARIAALKDAPKGVPKCECGEWRRLHECAGCHTVGPCAECLRKRFRKFDRDYVEDGSAYGYGKIECLDCTCSTVWMAHGTTVLGVIQRSHSTSPP